MDVRERAPDDIIEMIESALDHRQSQIHTSMPVKVIKDADGHTVSLQPLIKAVMKKPDGSTELVDYPVLQDVPIQFASGGGVTTTHPVKENDEGIIIISSRAIDAWHQQGGVQAANTARMHDLADAFYIPGVRSNPRKLENVSTTSTQMRSDDGKHVVDLHPTNGVKVSVDSGKHVMSVTPQAGISHESTMPVAIKAPALSMQGQSGGNLGFTLSGELTITGDLVVNGIRFSTHEHTGVQPGGSLTGPPTA